MHTSHSHSVFLADEYATQAFAQKLAPFVQRGGWLYLQGDLGMGKTCFVRALLQSCGVKGRIKSPSYTLLESYPLPALSCYHLDLYRFSDPQEWFEAGFDELLTPESLVLIEWPEQADSLLPPPDLHLLFEWASPGRQLTLSAHSERAQSWLINLFSEHAL